MTVAVDAVVYFRIHDATTSITNVENANRSTRLLAQTTLRNVLGTKNLSEILADREVISHVMQVRNCLLHSKMVIFIAYICSSLIIAVVNSFLVAQNLEMIL